ncbi:hypothetical protein GCM10022267_79440 [Lentzea roselyniae]|uniref:Uncharacterized protein n=1 Tax=Lentzea roselyniae TaxID=531940 RepID=A0ABP7C5P9_9PSEU
MEYLNSSLAVTPDEEVAEAPVVTTGITDAAIAQTAATRQTFLCTIFPSWPENPIFNYDRTAHELVTAETALTEKHAATHSQASNRDAPSHRLGKRIRHI